MWWDAVETSLRSHNASCIKKRKLLHLHFETEHFLRRFLRIMAKNYNGPFVQIWSAQLMYPTFFLNDAFRWSSLTCKIGNVTYIILCVLSCSWKLSHYLNDQRCTHWNPICLNTNGLRHTSDLTTGSQPEKLGLKNKWDFPAVSLLIFSLYSLFLCLHLASAASRRSCAF